MLARIEIEPEDDAPAAWRAPISAATRASASAIGGPTGVADRWRWRAAILRLASSVARADVARQRDVHRTHARRHALARSARRTFAAVSWPSSVIAIFVNGR